MDTAELSNSPATEEDPTQRASLQAGTSMTSLENESSIIRFWATLLPDPKHCRFWHATTITPSMAKHWNWLSGKFISGGPRKISHHLPLQHQRLPGRFCHLWKHCRYSLSQSAAQWFAICDRSLWEKLSNIKKIRVLFNQLYAYAMKHEIVAKDYSSYVNISKYKDRNPNKNIRSCFSDSEIAMLWKHQNDPYCQTVLMLIYNGVRVSELLNLKKKMSICPNNILMS